MISRLGQPIAIALLGLALAVPAWGQPDDEPALPPGLGDEKADAEQPDGKRTLADRLPAGLHGFLEGRFGPRIESDPAHSKRFTLAELRLQAAYDRAWKRWSLDLKGDLIRDEVLERTDADLRSVKLVTRPAASLDLQIGRQVMTWGTGDLLFVNDLFPKDWQSFFVGRDEEYLKAPADALRIGWFARKVSVDLVYAPEFEPDRYIRGERISFWDDGLGAFRGDDAPLRVVVPGDAFDDDEIAARIYGSVGSYEVAAYGYRGFWKSPGGFDPATSRATFPRLDVWGASFRGPLGPGIGSVEVGWYDSLDDRDGDDPYTSNGELRLLAGYELELGRELTGGFQAYVEHMLDHRRYMAALPGGAPRDEDRLVLTARITKLLRGQTLIPSVFIYYSPSDRDGYLRPKLLWKRSDHQALELGANVFFGRDDFTFFGRFENSSNVYGSFRIQL